MNWDSRMGSLSNPDPNDDYAFDPAEEFIGPYGRRISRKRLLAGGATIGAAAAAGPLIFTKVDAEELEKSFLNKNLPYNAHTGVKGHVVLWHHYGSPLRHGAIGSAIANFKRIYKHVTVSDVGFGFTADWTAMKTAIASGQGIPDVVVSDRPKLYYDGAKHHFYQDFTDLVKRDRFNMNAFWPFVRKDSVVKGKVYGLGWETDCRVMYHLRAQFIDKGLSKASNAGPKTWNDIKTYADKLDQKDGPINGWRVVTFDPLESYSLDGWVWTDKGDWVTSKGQPEFNSAGMVETATWIKQWLDRYGGFNTDQAIAAHSSGGQATNAMTANANNSYGWVAFHVDTPTNEAVWLFYDLRFYAKDSSGNATVRIDPFYGASLLPYNSAHKGAKPINLTGGFDLSMPRKKASKAQRDATWEFVKYMSLVGQQVFADKVLAIPSVLSMVKKDRVLTSFPNWSTFIKAMPYGHPSYPTNDPSLEGDAETSTLLNAMWRGDKGIKDTLDSIQSSAVTLNNRPGQ